MQKDFHFYAVAVLSRAAGFLPGDALTIAHASQYVDDSTESERVRIRAPGEDLRLDPVRTAHKGIDLLGALDWSAQKRVYMPFHFLPPQRFDSAKAGGFTFVTEKGARLGEEILEDAFAEPSLKRRLCRIGIALHAYADTWSHQRFSGRQSRAENDVENIRVCNPATNKYEHPFVDNILFDALPQIGHAEAGFHPDLAHETWRYDSRNKKNVARDNPQEFLDAARHIHDKLVRFRGTPPFAAWKQLHKTLDKLLRFPPSKEPGLGTTVTLAGYTKYHAQELETRCGQWIKEFGNWFSPRELAYSRTAWRDAALDGDTNWDDWSSREWDQMQPLRPKKGFWDSLWVHFHRAALRQRHFVLERLP